MNKLAQLSLAVQLPDDETFASYIGDTNKTVVAQLAQFISHEIPGQPYSFYLFGSQGVGKSHLLHACCVHASSLHKSSVCLSFSELKDLCVELFDGLEQIDLICLDDIQLIASDKNWQQAVFDLYNRMVENGKKLVIAGDQSALQLGITLPDLVSRLSWGYAEPIKTITDAEKISALQFRAKQRGLVLHDDVVKFLLNRLTRDMASLLNSLDILDKASIREQRKITIPFIKEILPSV